MTSSQMLELPDGQFDFLTFLDTLLAETPPEILDLLPTSSETETL